MGLELHLMDFLILRKFCKFFEFNPLYHVATLDHNVVTLNKANNPSLCHVTTLDLNVATLADRILDPSL